MTALALSVLYLVAGASLSPPGLALWTGVAASDAAVFLSVQWVVAGSFLLRGLSLLRPRAAPRGREVALVTAAFASVLASEALVRTALASEDSTLRNARLFAPRESDTFWLLYHDWGPDRSAYESHFEYEPELGWAPRCTAENPLGIIADGPYAFEPGQSAVLFFGDSYVEGTTDRVADRLPQQLARELGAPVFNYGVWGHCVGQIALRFQRSFRWHERPVVLVGLFSRDIDRTGLSVRESPKPSFRIDAGELSHRPVPTGAADREAWFDANRAPIRSFALGMLRQGVRRWTGGPSAESIWERDEKVAVTEHLLRRIVDDAKAAGVPLAFVLFWPMGHVLSGEPGWREARLNELLSSLEVPSFDAGQALIDASRARCQSARRYYGQDGHPSALGNAILAEALAQRMRAWWPEVEPDS